MADITDIVNYYVNLLIIQYHDKPKAKATIALLAEELLASGLLLDIQNAYNLTGNNPAVGPQLDVLGKYTGVDRYYSELNLINYFSLINYSEVNSLPSSPPRFGFETYATFGENDYNGTLTYSDIITENNALTDANFLTLIKFAIAINNCNFSYAEIAAILFKFFGDTVRAEPSGNMGMAYFITTAATQLIQAIIFKKLLPGPMGVGLSIITEVAGEIFGFTDYSGYESPYAHGLSTYSNYATLSGQFLTYGQIQQG